MFTIALMGCDSRKTDSTNAEAPAVRLGYFANLTHAQAVLGVASGELAAAIAPGKLSTKLFNAGPSLIEALDGGEVDIGYIGPGPALNAYIRSKGESVRIIAGAAANGVLIVARPGSGINTMADLAGKRLATPQHGNTQDISARHYLTAVLHQMDLNNVRPIANAEQASLMAQGQIDAAWAPEPWGSRLIAEAGAKLIGEEKDLWPGGQFTLAVVITTPKYLAAHPDVVAKVLKVHRSWTARLQAEPARYLPQLGDALYALSQKKLPPGVLASAITKVKFTDEPLDQTLKTMAQWSAELGFTPSPTALDQLLDLSILRTLQQSGGAPTTTEVR